MTSATTFPPGSATEATAGGAERVSRPGLGEVPRLLGRLGDGGPVLVCVAGLHGNEPSGVLALQRVFRQLAAEQGFLRGTVVGLAGNLAALAAGRRFLAADLNRCWTAQGIATAFEDGGQPEQRELVALLGELEPLLAPGGRRTLLDLHSTSGLGPPFVVLEDTLANRAFGRQFPVPLVLGIEEELAGTLTHFFTDRGVVNVGFEAGQHDDPTSVDRAAAAVWIALGASGVLPGRHPSVVAAQRWLEQRTAALPRVVEVRSRHSLQPGDAFRMRPGFTSFQRVRRGQPLAEDHRGEVLAPADGLLLMPLYQRQGDDGFFLARPVHRAWLELSAVLRRLRLERGLELLPGVERDAVDRDRYVVDTRVARWLALELFHLLGFRREGPPGRYLTMVRRHDG